MSQAVSVDELRRVEAFSDLSDSQLDTFLARSEYREFEAGDYLIRGGEPADEMMVILEGGFQVRAEGGDGPVYTAGAGEITGYLPFSRMTVFALPVRATSRMRVLTLNKKHFPALYQDLPELVPKLVAILTDRVRETARQTTQTDKLAAIGKLSAGLAHELNNPAAAALQATGSARKLFDCYRETLDLLAAECAPASLYQAVRALEARATASVDCPRAIDSLERSDLEEEISAWLASIQVEDGWRVAGAFVDAGFNASDLKSAVADWPGAIRELALHRVASSIEMAQVLAQMNHSTKRISDLVAAMKSYSFMDRAAEAEFDLNQNLETTLTLFSYRFKNKVSLEKSYDPELPAICAHGGQLNQVWTNLIDNALDAMEENSGRPAILRVKTRREMYDAIVEFTDTGHGIPPEVQARVFDPFFTTKAQGEGTGLGLDTVYRIVRQHHGSVQLESSPGGTTFTVRLPLRRAA